MNPLTALLLASVALLVTGAGLFFASWAWLRRHAEAVAA